MIGLWIRGLAALVGLFAVIVSAIVGSTYDDAEVRAFFTPPDCTAPCFLGIRPNTTTGTEARAILRQHPWVGDIRDDADGFTWSWNGKQPAFVSRLSNSFLLGSIDVRDGIVAAIHVQTTLPWVNLFLLFGVPDEVILLRESKPSAQYRVYDASYRSEGFEIETTTRCPITSREATWYSIVSVTWPVSGPILNSQRSLARSC